MKISSVLKVILHIPRSVILCTRLFGLKRGVMLPILFSNNCRVRGLRKGCIEIKQPRIGGVLFGIGGSQAVIENKRSQLLIEPSGKIIFEGKASVAQGCSIFVSGILKIGDKFSANKNCHINCKDSITFGAENMLAYDIQINDHDGTHSINGCLPLQKSVNFGDHIWICNDVNILKGVSIPDGCIIGASSLVMGKFDVANSVIAGHPAVVKKTGVRWDY